MTFKACKYCQVTQIQWDNELSAFRESDGKLHDRKRCEGIRGIGAGTSSGQPQQQQQQQQMQSQKSDTMWLIPKDDWDKVMSHIANMTIQLERLSEYYGDLLDYVRAVRPVDKSEQQMADAEAAYDTAKEDGSLYGDR